MGQAQQKRGYEGSLEESYYRQAMNLNLRLMTLSPDATVWDVVLYPNEGPSKVCPDQFRVHALTHRRGLDEIITLTQWIPRSSVRDDRYDVALILVGELEKLVRQKINGGN